jgi:DNA-binding MarR family transcriptional regulator
MRDSPRHTMLRALLLGLLLAAPMLGPAEAAGAGTAVETISGVVFDERGSPLEGVRVWCSESELGATTDALGAFQIAGPDLDGTGLLYFKSDGYQTASTRYELTDGASLVRNVYLVREQFAHTGTLRGTIRTVDGEAVPGAVVSINPGGQFENTSQADTAGLYEFQGVPDLDGPSLVTVEASGFDALEASMVVWPGRVNWLNLTLLYEGNVEVLRGFALDARGLPLPGAIVKVGGVAGMWTTDIAGAFRLQLEGLEGVRDIDVSLMGYVPETVQAVVPSRGAAWANVTLASDGRAGPETVWVMMTELADGAPVEGATVGLQGRQGRWATDAQGLAVIISDGLDGPLTVTGSLAGCTVASATVHLVDGGSASVVLAIVRATTATTLSGTVLDAWTGVPVEGARATLEVPGIARSTFTDDTGSFSLFTLPPGIAVRVTATAEGYEPITVVVVLQEFIGNNVSLVLHRIVVTTVDVAVAVRDAVTGAPVASAQLTLWDGPARYSGRTDAAGLLAFPGLGVSSGALRYVVEHRAYATHEGERAVGPSTSIVTIDIALAAMTPPRTSVVGWVRDPDGLPVAGATVALASAPRTWETTEDGTFEALLDLGADLDDVLTASAPSMVARELAVALRAHEESRCDVTLPLAPDAGNVLGTVQVEGSLRSLGGADVYLSRTGAFMRHTRTAADGSFAFTRVPAAEGSYELTVTFPDLSGASTEIDVVGARTVRYALRLAELVPTVETVTGTVRSAAGLPLPGATVSVAGLEPVTAVAGGAFSLSDTALEGVRALVVAAPGFLPYTARLDISPGGTAVVDARLEDAHEGFAIVTGTVATEDGGVPLEGAIVQLGWPEGEGLSYQVTTDANGTFVVLGVPSDRGDVTVYASAEGYRPGSAKVEPRPGLVAETHLRLERVRLTETGEGMTTKEKAAVGTGAGFLAALGALIATEVGRVALMGFLFLPLYTKIRRDHMMDHFVRGRIYEHICNNPGVNYSAIKERFNLTNGTVTYHLSMLERQEFIRSRHDGIYKRYFKAGLAAGAMDDSPMSLQRAIVKLVTERPGLTQKEIARGLGTSKQLVSYYVRNLREERLVETHRSGRHVRVYPGPNRPS